jgi:hypothetical protein
VQLREAPVKGRQPATVEPRELGQVGIRHLAMTDDAGEVDSRVRNLVGPELVPAVAGDRAEQSVGGRARLALAQQ